MHDCQNTAFELPMLPNPNPEIQPASGPK